MSSTFTIHNYDYECTKKCKCRNHGDRITSAITKKAISDENLIRFIAKTCRNFSQILDHEGRSALHMASSTDRYLIVEWLLNHGALINFKDQESGSSALHRAIYYGCIDCAVLLLRYGASSDLTDNDHLKPLQLICKLHDFSFAKNVPDNNELLVWGPNKNYNLGIGNEQGTKNPQFIDDFRKQNINIISMAISSYHSLFLDKFGNVYSVGHGKGGRLGIGTENSLPLPKKIQIPPSSILLSSTSNHKNNRKSLNNKTNNSNNSNNITNMANNLNMNTNNETERIIQISCSKNHSLLLTNKGIVYSCGINSSYQLGFDSKPEKLLNFKEIPSFQQYGINNLTQIIAKDQHSIAFNDEQLFVWGKNCGQFGLSHDIVDNIILPRCIHTATIGKKIKFVESSNTAIACCISGLQILLFHNYKIRVLRYPILGEIHAVCLTEREIDSKKSKNNATSSSTTSNLKMLILAEGSTLYIWYESLHQYIRCFLSPMRSLDIDKILFKNDQILLLSHGNVYEGKVIKIQISPIDDSISTTKTNINTSLSTITKNFNYHTTAATTLESFLIWDVNLPPNMKHEICSKHIIKIDLKHLSNIDRVQNIFCDDEFQSFGVLQENSRKYYQIPKFITEEFSFKNLLNDANEFDQTHDIIIHVDNEEFYCHKFIIYSRSNGLMKIINDMENNSIDKHIYLNFKNLTSKMFEIILKHIYTNYYLADEDLDDISRSLGPASTDSLNITKIFLNFVEKFELKSLATQIRNYIEGKTKYLEKPSSSKSSFIRLERTQLPELYDVTIKFGGGSHEIKAHKCILVSRLEYFNMMFNNSWSENKFINLNTIPYEYMLPMIDYLYTFDNMKIRKSNYSETFLYNMIIICDQFFINDLRKICEILLLDKISIRKCGEMLEFSHIYNCEILQNGCLEFICQNLQRVLMYKSLEECNMEILQKINHYYREMFKDIFDYRIITPYSNAISDNQLLEFVHDFNVDLKILDNETSSFPSSSSSVTTAVNIGSTTKIINKNMKIKSKFTVSKLAQSKRDYEKQAINSMNKLLLIDEETDQNLNLNANIKEKQNKNDTSKENDNDEMIKKQNWTKVNEKKDNKKKLTINMPTVAAKCNNIIKEEKQQPLKNDFVNLNNLTKNIDKNTNKYSNEENEHLASSSSPLSIVNKNRSGFSFGDLTPNYKFEKISQKQRKRLSSESKSSDLNSITSSPPLLSSVIGDNSINMPKKNVWGNTLINSADENEILSTSFAEIMKSPKSPPKHTKFVISPEKNSRLSSSPLASSSSSSFVSNSNTSNTGAISKNHFSTSPDKMTIKHQQQQKSSTSAFTKILEEEKKQKEYYEKMKNKSLILTQIEETAISELKLFYNVDNVFDERITIERKSVPTTMNFIVWQRN